MPDADVAVVDGEEPPLCSICYDEIAPGARVLQLACRHQQVRQRPGTRRPWL
jgi:hypothetical protein